jgi:hypothetical protein
MEVGTHRVSLKEGQILPDRSQVLTGNPMSYSIASDSLSVSELVEIANSVTVDFGP